MDAEGCGAQCHQQSTRKCSTHSIQSAGVRAFFVKADVAVAAAVLANAAA